ncbi:MAG: class I SAM-dependent methyltransferase, partial [Defluviicoccus sp.]
MLTDPDNGESHSGSAEPGQPPSVFLKAGQDRRIGAGHPWAYSNEIGIDRAVGLEAGSIVTLRRVDGKPLGVGFFNPHTLIAVRLLSREPHARIDSAFLATRLQRALALREWFYADPYYRLVHAEADGLPGLIVDRFGSVLVAQVNTAGMERLQPLLIDALASLFAPTAIVLRGDSPARALEGLPVETTLAHGSLADPVEVIEDGLVFYADVTGGQKTGWYFDQRPNRAFVAPLACGERMLDVFCHSGAFAIRAAAAGAREAIGVDSSDGALTLAKRAAAAAGLDQRCSFAREDAFAALT